LLAVGLGLAAGVATAFLLVVAGAALGGAATVAWLGAVTPLTSAMVAAATTGSALHWRKVCGHGAVHAGIIGTAMAVLLAAQFVRFVDVAALSQSGGPEALLRAATWAGAFEAPSSVTGLPHAIPGLQAVRDLFGPDGVWIFLVTELALVVALAWWMGARALVAPLCVACRAWCVTQRGVIARAGDVARPDQVRQRAAARDWRFFRDLGPARGGMSLRFDLARCPRCDRSNAVSVMWERPPWRDRRLVGDLRLASDDVRTLLEIRG
jgi:hypothetical protein